VRFWDSSAILPLLVEETTAPNALAYYQANPDMVVWWVSPVECASAMARLEREKKLEPADVTQALGQLATLQAAWHEVQPLDNIRQLSQRLLRLHPLRAADSLQLAAALVACQHKPQSTEFVCLNTRLGLAAEREGFSVINRFSPA
jgi:predicted nucleic acid-binding protein